MATVDTLRTLAMACKDLRVQSLSLHPDGSLAEFTMDTSASNMVTQQMLEQFRKTLSDAMPDDKTVEEWSMPGTGIPLADPSVVSGLGIPGMPVLGATVSLPPEKAPGQTVHTARSRRKANQ